MTKDKLDALRTYDLLGNISDDLNNSTHLLNEIIDDYFDSNSTDTPENRRILAYNFDHYAALMEVYRQSVDGIQTQLQSILEQLRPDAPQSRDTEDNGVEIEY